MDIEHLDFDTPSDADLVFDEFGMPLNDDTGTGLYRATIDALNSTADQRGWDQPAHLYLLSSPLTVQSTLGDVRYAMVQVAKSRGLDDTLDEDATVLGFGILDAGDLDVAGGGELWGQDAPANAAAVLLSMEAFVPWDVLDVEPPRRVKERPREDERAEMRLWMLVTRAGAIVTQAYLRKGRHKSTRYEDPDFLVQGVVLTVLARTVEVLCPPATPCVPMTPQENMSLRLLWPLLSLMRETDDTDKWDLQTAFDLFAMCDPWVQWSDEELVHITQALADPDPDARVAWMGRSRDLFVSAYANAEHPTWVDSMWRATRSSRFFPDAFPQSAEMGEWAGEVLLAMLAGYEGAPLLHEVAALWAQSTPTQQSYAKTLLDEVRLPLPVG